MTEISDIFELRRQWGDRWVSPPPPTEFRGWSIKIDGHWLAYPTTGDVMFFPTIWGLMLFLSEHEPYGAVEVWQTERGDEPGSVIPLELDEEVGQDVWQKLAAE